MFRRRKHGIADAVRDVPVGLFCFELLYADGQDLTRLPYPQRRASAGRGDHPVALAQAHDRHPGHAPPPSWTRPSSRRSPTAARGWCASRWDRHAAYQAGARGWQWIKLKRDYRTELSDTVDLVVVGAFAGTGPPPWRLRRAAAAAYDPAADTFRTVGKCGTGFSDAETRRPARQAGPAGPRRAGRRVDTRQRADVWFEPGSCWKCSAPS